MVVLADGFLDIDEELHRQVARQDALHALVDELEHGLKRFVDLLRKLEEGGLVARLHHMVLDPRPRHFVEFVHEPVLLLDHLMLQDLVNLVRDALAVRDREDVLAEDTQALVEHAQR